MLITRPPTVVVLCLPCLLLPCGCAGPQRRADSPPDRRADAPPVRRAAARRAEAAAGPTASQRVAQVVTLYCAGEPQRARAALDGVPAADREPVTREVIRELLTIMEGREPTATTPAQVRAKDALFALRGRQGGLEPRIVTWRIVTWVLARLSERSGGEHSAEAIIRALGRPAYALLGRRLVGEDGAAKADVARMIRKLGDQQARDEAAARLVALAKKEAPPRVQTFHALGQLGGAVAVAYLVQRARQGPHEQRAWALRALQLCPDPGAIATADAIAGDARLKDDAAVLRDEAFTLLQKIQHPRSLAALARYLSDRNMLVRYRTVEALLGGFKVEGLKAVLGGLAPRAVYKKDDLIDFVEKDIVELGEAARPALLEALGSRSWIARLVAVRALARIGRKEDAPAVKKLVGDRTRVRGWEGRVTIGSQARLAVEALESR